MRKILAPLLTAAALATPAWAAGQDKAANSLVASSKGMLEWLAQGYTVAGATVDMVILTGGRGSIVVCRIAPYIPRGISGLGSNSQKREAPAEDVLDASRCYAPRGQ